MSDTRTDATHGREIRAAKSYLRLTPEQRRQIGERVAAARQTAFPKLTQQQFADKAGIHVATLSRMEQGRRDPDVASLLRVMATIGVSASAILDTQEVSDPHAQNVSTIDPATLRAAFAEVINELVVTIVSALAKWQADALRESSTTGSGTAGRGSNGRGDH